MNPDYKVESVMSWLFGTLHSMGESVLSSGGSNCKFGRNGSEKNLDHGLKVFQKHTKRSSYAGSDGLMEASKSSKGAAQYQLCLPSPIDEKDCYGGELHTQKEAANDENCLNHETSDIPWTLQECTPLEFAALSQAMADIDDIDQALNMSPRSLIRSVQAQHFSPESESVRKQSTNECGDIGYECEYASTNPKWSVRNNPIASLGPESVANMNNNFSDRSRRSMVSTQEKLDHLASSSIRASTFEKTESVSSLSASSNIDLLLGIRNKHTEEELLISTMQLVPNKQNLSPRVRYPKEKLTKADLDSRKEFSIYEKFKGENAFCMILAELCSFMKLIPRGLNWSLMFLSVSMAVIAIQIYSMKEEKHVLVPT